MATHSLVLDNGADTVKLWHSADGDHTQIRTSTNAVVRCKDDRRTFVGRHYDEAGAPFDGALLGTLQFRRPVERGYLCNWEAERAIWQSAFAADYAGVDPSDTLLVATEPLGNLPILKSNVDESVFEEFGFAEYHRTHVSSLCAYGRLGERLDDNTESPTSPAATPLEACVVLDIGFSATTCVPVVDGVTWENHTRRLPLGGKFLTNWLKEQLSFRQFNLMEEFSLVDRCKKAVCFTSLDFASDIERSRRAAQRLADTGRRDDDVIARYALPDFAKRLPDRLLTPGTATHRQSATSADDDEVQLLMLGNERFRTPELLFRPSDIGMVQHGGVAELVSETITSVADPALRSLMWDNIIVVGGSSQFPNLITRLRSDLGGYAPQGQSITLHHPPPTQATTYACSSGADMIDSAHFAAHRGETVVSRAEWLESGRRSTLLKFDERPRGMWDRPRHVGAFATTKLASSSAADGRDVDLAAALQVPASSRRNTTLGTGTGTPLGNGNAESGTGTAFDRTAPVKKSIYVEEDLPDTPRSFSPDTVISDDGETK